MGEKRFRKNPRYQLGDAIRKAVRRDNLRQSYGMNLPYGASSQYEHPSNVGVSSNEFYPNIDDEGNIVPLEEDGAISQAAKAVGKFLFGNYENAADMWDAASLADSYRLFQEKRLQAETTNKLNQVAEARQKLKELQDASDFSKNIDLLYTLRENYDSAIKENNTELAESIQKQFEEVLKKIRDYQENIKTTGKESDINVGLFFDPNKATGKENAEIFFKNIGPDSFEGDWYNPLDGLRVGLSTFENVLTSTAQGIDKIIYPSTSGNFTRRAIKNSKPEDRWTDNLYIDYVPYFSSNGGETTENLRQKIAPLQEYWEQELENRVSSAKEAANKYKNGTWYFDPQKINPKFRYYSENNDAGLIGGILPHQLLYSFSEMGSSYSDLENMAGMMLTDFSAGLGAKAIATLATSTNPYIKAALTLDTFRKLRAAGKVVEAAKLEARALEAERFINRTNTAVKATEKVLGAGTTAANVYFVNRMREHETNSEVIDAWASRVLQNCVGGSVEGRTRFPADMEKVLGTTRNYLDQIGISTENMTDIDLVQHALAYDIPTGDPVFENEKNKAKRGLQKVYNDNMSLAAKDYIEAMPFLNFSGSFLKSFGRGVGSKFADQTYTTAAKSLTDRTINKLAGQALNENLSKKLMAKHSVDFLKKAAKARLWIASLEGIEEGQQELLQSRYSRGLYDNYDKRQDMFSLPAILDDTQLASEAVAAYFGMLWGDPDNSNPQLKRAMQIGSVSGGMSNTIGLRTLTNLLPSTGKDNIRDLIGQLRNDRFIGRLVGDAYGIAQDDNHMSIFYDAFSKHGINNQRMAKSLQDLKMFKGELVSDEYIDRDIDLMNNVWYAYNSNTLNNFAQSFDYVNGSDNHKKLVKYAARKLTEKQETQKFTIEDLRRREGIVQEAIRKIYSYTKDAFSDYSEGETVEPLDPDIDNLLKNISEDYLHYKKERQSRKKELQKTIKELEKEEPEVGYEYQGYLKEENTAQGRLKKAKEELEALEKNELSYQEYLEKTIRNLYQYQDLLNAELLVDNYSQSKLLQEEISRELGIDFATNETQSFINALLNQRDMLEKLLENEDVYEQNELRKKINKLRKKGQRALPLIENIARKLKKKYGNLPNQEEANKVSQRLLLNRAAYDVVSPVSDMFITGKLDPRIAVNVAQPLAWRSLSNEEQQLFIDNLNKERKKQGKQPMSRRAAVLEFSKQQKEKIKKLIKDRDDYVKHLHEYSDQDNTVEGDLDAEILLKDTARDFIEYQLNNYEELRRINHREFLRSDVSPVELNNRAEDGDLEAQEVLDQINEHRAGVGMEESEINLAAPSDETTNVVNESPRGRGRMSRAEANLRERLGMDLDDEEDTSDNEDLSSDESEIKIPDSSSEESISKLGIDEQDALLELDIYGHTRYDDYLQTRSERTVQSSDQIYVDFLGQTFKYDPEADTTVEIKNVRKITKRDGTVEYKDVPIKFKDGGQLRPGNELGKKLLTPGWFESADKYFVITVNERTSANINDPDNFVVCMVIQDGKDVYATFMEGLENKRNDKGGKISYGPERVYKRMDQLFYDPLYKELSSDSYEEAVEKRGRVKNARDVIFTDEYIKAHPREDRSKVKIEDVYKWYNKLSQEEKDSIDFALRKALSNNRSVFTNEKIREQINSLRNTRNQIINSALNKNASGEYIIPDSIEEYKQVVPLNPRISDGRINEQKTRNSNGTYTYTYRNLLDGGFGMSTDLEELTQQIKNEEVKLGLGRGERAFEGSKGKIDKLDPSAPGNYETAGYGYAGKIYYIATTVHGEQRAIMLTEKKFRPSAELISPEEIVEHFTAAGDIRTGETPSIAEFILYLVTDKISDKVFTGIPAKYIPRLKQALLDIIVHADKRTWIPKKDELKYQYLSSKQFFYDEKTDSLVIAIPNNRGVYRSVSYKVSGENGIFMDEVLRKTAISAIANNLHWNTDREALSENMPIGLFQALGQVFERNSELSEYKIAGIDDLTFKKDQLFDSDMNPKDVSLIAWMIGNGKLLTTVGETPFYAPFVYADGAVLENPAAGEAADLKTNIDNANEIHGEGKTVDDRLGNVTKRLDDYNAQTVNGLLFVKDKKTRQKLQEGQPILDFSILDVDAGNISKNEIVSDEEIEKGLENAVDRFIEYINKEYDLKLNRDSIVATPSKDEYQAVASGQALFTAQLLDGNRILISVDSINSLAELSQDNLPISGVYSTVKSDGTLDASAAREWIKQTLGLSDSQIIITNAVLNGVSNEQVFGVTNVAVDSLNNVMRGVFMLRKIAGRGLHYHEAFHYVNLLLHNKEQRENIYKAYVKLHPELRGEKFRVIEEHLAEDFRRYCEILDDKEARLAEYKGPKRWISKILNTVVDFVKHWRRTNLIEKLFIDIRSAKYKNMVLDEESVKQFNKAYNNGVYQAKFFAQGATEDQISNLKSITNYQQFYQVAESAAHQFLDFANVKKVENISNINANTFIAFIEKLKRDNLRRPNVFIQDIIDNPAAFDDAINTLLRQYGVVRQNKKTHGTKQQAEDSSESSRNNVNEIQQLAQLYDNYVIDQKTNVAFRAKLFLCQIKDTEFVYDENTKRNTSVIKKDENTGLSRYVSYDDAWHIITSNLNTVDSFEELLKRVQQLSKTKTFFAELYKNLLSVGADTQLQTQIYRTVNKHLTTVAQIEVKSKRRHQRRSNIDEEYTSVSDTDVVSNGVFKEYDQDKQLEILNDNTLKAKKMLPRDWSKDLFASPLITYDKFHHINKKYVDEVLKPLLQELKDDLRANEKLTSQEKEQVFNKIFPKLLNLLQKMSIPFDEDVLTEYILIHVEEQNKRLNRDDVSMDQMYEAVKEILADPRSSTEKSANISFFINTVFSSSLLPVAKLEKRKIRSLNIKGYSAKKLDALYEGQGGEINKMAIAYNNVHPSARELSVTGPGNTMIYPLGENNFISDIIRWINKNRGNIIEMLSNTPYAKNSQILEIARGMVKYKTLGDLEFKLNVFVGMEDEKSKRGVDYFGINSLEDTISKMMFTDNNMIILPTMADKKTYYVIELVSRKTGSQNELVLPHDRLYNSIPQDLVEKGYDDLALAEIPVRRFSDSTIERFIQYFEDELDSLDQYYDKKNIEAVVKNRQTRKKNFHGKVKNGKMDFSGNGGKFRYFYGLKYPGLYGERLTGLNLNQLLEYEYNRQKEASDPTNGMSDGVWSFREDSTELDGFESIRQRLKEIREYFFENKEAPNRLGSEALYDAINEMLFSRVDDNMEKYSATGESQLIYRSEEAGQDGIGTGRWYYSNKAIPTQLVSKYVQMFTKDGRTLSDNSALTSMSSYQVSPIGEDIVLSVIGNYVVQSMISTIEVEKVFSGDPAFYKWSYADEKEHKIVNDVAYDFQILVDKDTDKIKRLGALLSPGAELRTDFSPAEYAKYPWLRGTKFVNATISDVRAKSIYLNELKNIFGQQLVADIYRQKGESPEVINNIYLNTKVYKEKLQELSEEQQKDIEDAIEKQLKPYNSITVSDAQVLVRPDFYRKIRMMLGEWSTIPIKIKYKDYSGVTHETTYSDNEAFDILENDPEWIVDPEKAAKVSRLQLFPLKMTYFKNDSRQLNSGNNIAYGVYDKQAIFPAFKYLMRSTTGQKIYNRMNRKQDPLDLLTFESAVKVGLNNDIYSPYDSGTSDLSVLKDGLDQQSGATVDENDVESWLEGDEVLSVEVQDIRGLRMQLNTEAHDEIDRTIGTQMFKIMFSNIYDDEDYGLNKDGGTIRKGKEIREDIMQCIKALTALGAKDIKKRFYNEDGKTINDKAVKKYLQHVIENNNISGSVQDILNNGGTIESLMQRTLFEHSISSVVNSSVIDITTNGGSAIQQSVFGFVSYGVNQVRTEQDRVDGFPVLNDGRELNWNEKDGTMEVMLSMNFFKSVVPYKYRHSYKEMRNWLVNHDIIKGFKHIRNEDGTITVVESKPKPFGIGYRIPTQGLSSTFAFVVADVLPEQSGDLIVVPREFTAQTGSDFDKSYVEVKFL